MGLRRLVLVAVIATCMGGFALMGGPGAVADSITTPGGQGALPGEDVPALAAEDPDPPVVDSPAADEPSSNDASPDESSANLQSPPLLVPDPAAYEAQKAEADRALPLDERPVPDSGAADESVDAPGVAADGVTPAAASVLNRQGLVAHADPTRRVHVPPDTTGAIGPSDYVEMVNSEIAVYGRGSLAQESRLFLNTFVGAAAKDSVFDVQIQWDPVGQRWFYLADRVTGSGRRQRAFLAYGWSRTANPRDLRSGWCRFKTPSGTRSRPRLFDDFPKLGHADNHLVFGTNVFRRFGSNDFLTSRIYAVSKPAAGSTACGRPSVRRFGEPGRPLLTSDGARAFTPVPANTIDASPNGYVVAAAQAPASQIMQWHITGPPASPALIADGNIAVPAYQMPPTIPQPRIRFRLDSLDGRLTQAVAAVNPLAAGQLTIWTQHTVRGPDARSVARWYELLPATRAVHQAGTVQVAGQYVFNAAISPSGGLVHDDAAINYNVAGLRLRPQIRASSQEDFGTPNQMGGEVTLGTSLAIDRSFDCYLRRARGVCRWGDYAGASPDPAADDTVWGSNQTLGSVSRQRCAGHPCPYWRTRNFELRTGP